MIKRRLAILFLAFCWGAETRQAVGLDALSIGADALARGGAYLAAEQSNHYVFQNYAFLGHQPTPRFSLTAFNLISEVGYFAAAYSQPNFSLGFLRLQENGGELRDSLGNLQGGVISYTDSTFYGAYGWKAGQYSFGLRAKLQNKYFSEVDVSARGLALDLSGVYQARLYLTVGAELRNLAATKLLWSNGLEENFGKSLGLGGIFKAGGPDGYWASLRQPINIYTDIRAEETNYLSNTGIEYWPCSYVALRGGLKQKQNFHPGNNPTLTEFTAGLGFNYANIYVDYAYNSGTDLAENLTHFFTVAYRWAEPKTPPEVTSKKPSPPKPPIKYKQTFRSTLGDTEL
ncbi:hypothetical protein NO2_1236 [Candidatus Termititenax persephonae]|uniref:Type IX secretion system membrane protein PorP/SprF n=1 Tax=Candidatus Termititenax persephonae TaxID=2218525 RepID=A0A388TJT0_9BACT|nr:hypothetical protein NO2_1236 [Candidatus Termititenax persephonae]